MDYELMTNNNIKIGQKAPDFNAITTYGNKKLEDYNGKWLVFFLIQEVSHQYVRQR